MAYCSWICSTFCFLAGCTIIMSIGCSCADTTQALVIPSNTSNSTSNDTAVEYVDYGEMTYGKRSGVVTIEYHFKTDNKTEADAVSAVHRRTKEVVVKVLNSRDSAVTTTGPVDHETATPDDVDPASRRRRRRAAAATYDVELVAVDPPVKDGRLRTPLVAADQDGKVMTAEELENELHNNKQQIDDETGYTVAGIYAGLPPDVQPPAYVDDRPTIWQKHFWMFMVVIILLLIALITGVLCCICWYCCRKTDDKAKQPPAAEKKAPAPVVEKIQPVRAAPVQQSAAPPPSQPPMKEQPTTTAAPPPPHSDDENGWIIPLDQLSQDELDQPEVQISRL